MSLTKDQKRAYNQHIRDAKEAEAVGSTAAALKSYSLAYEIYDDAKVRALRSIALVEKRRIASEFALCVLRRSFAKRWSDSRVLYPKRARKRTGRR